MTIADDKSSETFGDSGPAGTDSSSFEPDGGLRRVRLLPVVFALLAMIAAIAAVLVINTTTTESAGSPGTKTQSMQTAPTTVPETTTTVTDSGFPIEPVKDEGAEGDMFGWGTAQPTQMRATVHYGGTNTPMTRERRQLLADQLVQAREAALSIGTVAEAERQGFVKNFQRLNGRGFEYVNWSNFSHKLDLSKPTVLAFEDDKPDSRIVSIAYNVLGTVQDGPPTDLPLEVIPWHYHSNLCKKGNSIVGSVEYDENGVPYADQAARCRELGAEFRPELNHWMVDLWVVPGWENPWGLVSSKHPDLMFEPTPWFDSAESSDEGQPGHHSTPS